MSVSSTLSLLITCLTVVVTGSGVLSPSTENKIHGGDEVDISRVPWLVVVYVLESATCFGAIISPQWVLASAFCTVARFPDHIYVTAASKDTTKPEAQKFSVEKVVNHEQYLIDWRYSIGALKTVQSMLLDGKMSATKLPNSQPVVGSKQIVYGGKEFGETNKLRAMEISVKDLSNCKNISFSEPNKDLQLCVDSVSSCGIKPGGLLVKDGVLEGLVPIDDDFCRRGLHLYTSVAGLKEWIEKTTAN